MQSAGIAMLSQPARVPVRPDPPILRSAPPTASKYVKSSALICCQATHVLVWTCRLVVAANMIGIGLFDSFDVYVCATGTRRGSSWSLRIQVHGLSAILVIQQLCMRACFSFLVTVFTPHKYCSNLKRMRAPKMTMILTTSQTLTS